MRTRSLKKEAIEEAEQPQTGILRNSEMLAELKDAKAELLQLRERGAAAEERAFHQQRTLKELTDTYHMNMEEVKRTQQSLTMRLEQVEKKGRALIKFTREAKAKMRGLPNVEEETAT